MPRLGHRSPGLTRAAAIALALALAIASFAASFAVTTHAASSSFEALSTAKEDTQLAAAQSSLHSGAGPAHGNDGFRVDITPLANSPQYSWTNLTGVVGQAPSPRYAAMTWDAADGYVLLFGGEVVVNDTTSLGPLDDTWSYLNGTWTNLTGLVVGSPPALAGASMVYDPPGGSVILFGGEYNSVAFANATWSYHADVWTNLTTSVGPAPSARELPALVYDTSASEILMTGGIASGGVPSGTWVFKNTTWTNVTSHSVIPANLIIPVLANDPSQNGVFMEGLMSYSNGIKAPYYTGSFLYAAGVWTNLTPSLTQHPPTILAANMNYVSPAEGILLTCGLVIDQAGDQIVIPTVTWQYLNGAWTNLTGISGAGPLPQAFAGSAVDPADESILFFGGEIETLASSNSETWSLSAPPSVNVSASPARVDVGTPVALSSQVSLGLSPNRLSWSFGDGGTSSATTPSHSYDAPGLYTASATVVDFAGQIGVGAAAILVAAPPTVAITVTPVAPTAGSAAGLVATVTGGTPPYSIQWNLGDGTTASGPVVSHTYSSAQTYRVQVTLMDEWGSSASSNLSVVVGSGSTSSGGSSTGLSSGYGLVLIGAVVALALLAAAFAVLWLRKPKNPPPPVPYGAGISTTATAPASTSSGPPRPP